MMYEVLAHAIPQLARGTVWCTHCGRSRSIRAAARLRDGWPNCCGYTMTIDSPEERAALVQTRHASPEEK